MLEDVLAQLAMTGATTVVAAMATNAWDTTRGAVVQLFRRDDNQQAAIAAQLDGDATLVGQDADADGARQDLISSWRRRMENLLRQYPDAQEELQAIVDDVQDELPQPQRQ